MYDFPHYMIGMHWFWWLFWIAAIVAVWWTFTRRPPAPSEPTATNPHELPLDRLQRRYADGEIATEEYEERKAVLLRDR
ncbi:MAG: SHOCT domain-containing protein [Rhodothermales bacterium]|jgi:putative membrane protein